MVVCALAAELLLGNTHARESLWAILMSANQLIAALTLLTATMWFVKNHKPCWLTAIPMVFMMVVSAWALALIFRQSVASGDVIRIVATGFLLMLAVVLAALGISKFRRN